RGGGASVADIVDSNSYNRINDICEALILKISISSMLIRYYAKRAMVEIKPPGGGGGRLESVVRPDVCSRSGWF
ncbi:hypothetical protein ACDT17_16915, partial [Chromobacterium piscinae]|uniref:hypothetical protein n=1 Tax=Chromobacterium piscinae TaxID=686831 RepID=UPI0035584329